MAITSCIACRKEVEENTFTCPYCGTESPKRVMLASCRICGEEVGKTARECPHCKSSNPYWNKNLRGYIAGFLFISIFFYLPVMGRLKSIQVLDDITLEHIYLIAFWGAIIWTIYKDLKDSAGLNHYFFTFWRSLKSSSHNPCLKCYTPVPKKSVTCHNCGEPVTKNNLH